MRWTQRNNVTICERVLQICGTLFLFALYGRHSFAKPLDKIGYLIYDTKKERKFCFLMKPFFVPSVYEYVGGEKPQKSLKKSKNG